MKKGSLLLLAIGSMPMLLSAHPGHGDHDGWSIIHYLVHAEHVLPYAVVVVALVVIAAYRMPFWKARKKA